MLCNIRSLPEQTGLTWSQYLQNKLKGSSLNVIHDFRPSPGEVALGYQLDLGAFLDFRLGLLSLWCGREGNFFSCLVSLESPAR